METSQYTTGNNGNTWNKAEMAIAMLSLSLSIIAIVLSFSNSKEANLIANNALAETKKANSTAEKALDESKKSTAISLGEVQTYPRITFNNSISGDNRQLSLTNEKLKECNISIKNIGQIPISALRLKVSAVITHSNNLGVDKAVNFSSVSKSYLLELEELLLPGRIASIDMKIPMVAITNDPEYIVDDMSSAVSSTVVVVVIPKANGRDGFVRHDLTDGNNNVKDYHFMRITYDPNELRSKFALALLKDSIKVTHFPITIK